MNILLTGGLGYIASHTAIELSKLGHKVFLYDNLSNSDLTTLEKLEELTGSEILFCRGDLLDRDLLVQVLKENNIDIVIHLAGLKSVKESVHNPLDYFQNNVCGTLSLLEAMSVCNIKKIIFSSSASVYGDPKSLPISEQHPLSPLNPYAESKRQIEGILNHLANSDPNWKIISLRYFNPIGAHSSGLIGENPKGTPNNLVPYISRVAIGEQPYLLIFGNDYSTLDGTGVRDYIHVVDLALGHSSAVDYLSKNFNSPQVFNLGTGNGYSVLEVLKVFEDVSGIEIPYKFTSRRKGDSARCYADPSKATKMLNWNAKRNLVDMLASEWNWLKNR